MLSIYTGITNVCGKLVILVITIGNERNNALDRILELLKMEDSSPASREMVKASLLSMIGFFRKELN